MTQNAHSRQASDGSDDAAMRHATHVDSVSGYSTGWVVAAPDGSSVESADRSIRPATHSETAGNFFDVVFLSVALVAYSPNLGSHAAPVHTKTCRDASSGGGFLHRRHDGVHDLHRSVVSSSVRFPRVSSETCAHSDSTNLSSLRLTAPPLLNISLPLCPTGPPRLPSVAVRGWTSRYA